MKKHIKVVIISIGFIVIGLLSIHNIILEKRISNLTALVMKKDKQIAQKNIQIKDKDQKILDLSLRSLIQSNSRNQNIYSDLIPKPNQSNPAADLVSKLKQDCQADQEKYNSCLIKYNTDMIEFQSCQTCKQNKGFGCELVCSEPYNSCNALKPSSLCND